MFITCCKRKSKPLAEQEEDNYVIELIDWECPICFSTVDEVSISFPYQCAHPTCFKCFREQCEYLRPSGKCMTCCLCRMPVKERWMKNASLSSRNIVTKDNIVVRIYDTRESGIFGL